MKGFWKELAYPANLASLLRMLLAPVWIYAIYAESGSAGIPWFTLGLAVFMAATDWIDGALARALHQVSGLGLVLDPLADKVCILGGGVAVVLWWGFPLWFFLVVLGRDVLILAGSLFFLGKRGKVQPSRLAGKLTSLVLTVMVLLFLLRLEPFWQVAMGASLVVWAWSSVEYAVLFEKLVKGGEEV
jgi:CDP-diacylglycerol--glycerol-3-phosphate 3-phosphatidyltransferase